MTDITLEVTYIGGRPLVAYIRLEHRAGDRSARTEEISPGLLIDYSAENAPLGIEIVSPQRVTTDEINSAFDHIGVRRPDPAELAPLRAA